MLVCTYCVILADDQLNRLSSRQARKPTCVTCVSYTCSPPAPAGRETCTLQTLQTLQTLRRPAGYYGADCSLSTAAGGRPEQLAGMGYKEAPGQQQRQQATLTYIAA